MIYDRIRLIPYSDSQIEGIVRIVVDKYLNDLKSRGYITYDLRFWAGDMLYLGGGTDYVIKPLEYALNGEKIKVFTSFRASSDDMVKSSKCQIPSEDGCLDINIIREAKKGERQLICILSMTVDKKHGNGTTLKCTIRGKTYSTSDRKSISYPTQLSLSEIVCGRKIENEIADKKVFSEFISGLVVPAEIYE